MIDSLSSVLSSYHTEKRENKASPPILLRGYISESSADASSLRLSLRTRVTFEGFDESKFKVATCKSGGTPVKLLTPEGVTIEVRLDTTSLEKRFLLKSQDCLNMLKESQKPTPEQLHATIHEIAPKITCEDLDNALHAIQTMKPNSPNQKIAHVEYNAAHPDKPIPRNIIYIDGKPFLHLNRHTEYGDPTIAETNGKRVGYCLGLHDNKLYAMISSPPGMPFGLDREIPYLEALQGKKNIVQSVASLKGTGVVSHKPKHEAMEKTYLVEPLYQGGNLATTKITNEAQKVAIAKQITSGLALMHQAGILNRDIKPENIFLSNKGQAYIGDFDTACFLNDDKERVKKDGGTLPYLAPELAKLRSASQCNVSNKEALKTVDRPIDVYGMGCVLHELFIGPIAEYPVFPDVATALNPMKDIAAIDKDWMPKPKDGAPTIHHIIWSMVHVDPKKRITADQAASAVAAL